MKYNIRGNKLEVTDAINDYIKSKLSKIEKYLDDNDEVEAKAIISARGKDQKVEVTIWSGKYNIRAEEINPDLYSAIDLVIDKLERQFKKYKSKLSSHQILYNSPSQNRTFFRYHTVQNILHLQYEMIFLLF